MAILTMKCISCQTCLLYVTIFCLARWNFLLRKANKRSGDGNVNV